MLDSYDPNAVKITNGEDVFIGHIAIQQPQGFRSMLRESAALDTLGSSWIGKPLCLES